MPLGALCQPQLKVSNPFSRSGTACQRHASHASRPIAETETKRAVPLAPEVLEMGKRGTEIGAPGQMSGVKRITSVSPGDLGLLAATRLVVFEAL